MSDPVAPRGVKGEKYITTLVNQNVDLQVQIRLAHGMIADMMKYYASAKFQGDGNDYAHVSTDLMPRLLQLRSATLISE